MKRILFGLGCTLVIGGGLVAQDSSPAARLGRPGAPIIRAQSPELQPVAGFEVPKTMPKGAVAETPGTGTPPSLPAPGIAPIPGPAVTIPPGGTIVGPVITEPHGPVYGAPIPSGPPIFGDPLGGSPFVDNYGSDPSNWYVGFEAMVYWVTNYNAPPLITAGTAGGGANLNAVGTSILYGYGNRDVDDNPRYGGRLTLGCWLNPCWALELSAFYMRSNDDVYSVSSTDVPTQDLARPFYDVNNKVESSEIIGRPGVASGGISVTTRSYLGGIELNLRNRWWSDCANRIDLIAGGRYLVLAEELEISEQSLGLAGAGPLAGVERRVEDTFKTFNTFYGLQVGGIFQHVEGSWTFELRAKIAAGLTRQIINVDGGTFPVSGGAPATKPGGLLALGSNMGERQRDVFAVVPEVGLNVGYDITPRLRVFAGYSLIFWSNVARPGPQIDRSLDINQIPDFPGGPAASEVRPAQQSNFQSIWIHGANFGVAFKW